MVTPAVAGPFDLGTVVVRVPLFVDPETAQIHAVADPIPDVFGGAKLDIRSVVVNVNRKEFTLNGTNCSQVRDRRRRSGAAAPTRPTRPPSPPSRSPTRFQAERLRQAELRPKLNLRLFGATKRAKNPKLRAMLKARAGRRQHRAAPRWPAARALPRPGQPRERSAPGSSSPPATARRNRSTAYARAFTPLLGKPLEGPVYLRSSNNPLPDLVAHLEGQVDIDLVGRIDSFKGGIRTTFDRVPDVPVSKFVMTLPGGKHGLLVASRNLCKKPVKAIVQLKGQNGKKANKRQKLRTPCGKQSTPASAKRRDSRSKCSSGN